MSMKNPLTLAGIEPVIFRFLAQHLNHCATAVPTIIVKTNKICSNISRCNSIYIDLSHQIYLSVVFTIPEEHGLKL